MLWYNFTILRFNFKWLIEGAEVGHRSLFKALDELCFNRTVHPSIHRIIAAVGIKAWAMHACMHDDRLCEERSGVLAFRADITVLLLLFFFFAINATTATDWSPECADSNP